jgi:hypothetical protein
MINEKLEQAIGPIRPLAKEFLDELNKEKYPTTQNNYGRVLAMITHLQEKDGKRMAQLFLVALTREGYPQSTARQLFEIMGW